MKLAYFFDGTGNNMTNSSKDQKKFGNITNIAKLYNNCTLEPNNKLYVEGIGTINNKDDSNIAKATGNNPPFGSGYSYKDKLGKALKHFNSKLNTKEDLEVFVYGFSRGATLARDFSKQILKNKQVKIRFLGLYDTVVSLLTEKPDVFFSDSDLEKTDIIIHLCAIHEARKYFPLTPVLNKNTDSALVKIENTFTSKTKEIFVPGAHADVGGGYLEKSENIFLNEIRSSCDSLIKELNLIKTTLKDNFSCRQNPIWNELLTDTSCVSAGLVGSNLASQRDEVFIDISDVYFILILKYTNDKENIFNSVNIESLDSLFKDLLEKLYKYLKSDEPSKGICFDDYNQYKEHIHISSNYGNIDSKNANKYLNTFDPTLLNIEIENLKLNSSIDNFEIIRKDDIYKSLGINPLYVNQPNNKKWHRAVFK